MIDIRYIYLLRMKGTGKYKIGIAKNVSSRRSSIDNDIPKRQIKVVLSRRVCLARDVERKLHTKFQHKWSPLRNVGPNAGRTEWFRLSFFDRLRVRFWFYYYSLIYWIFIFTVSIVILDILILIIE